MPGSGRDRGHSCVAGITTSCEAEADAAGDAIETVRDVADRARATAPPRRGVGRDVLRCAGIRCILPEWQPHDRALALTHTCAPYSSVADWLARDWSEKNVDLRHLCGEGFCPLRIALL